MIHPIYDNFMDINKQKTVFHYFAHYSPLFFVIYVNMIYHFVQKGKV